MTRQALFNRLLDGREKPEITISKIEDGFACTIKLGVVSVTRSSNLDDRKNSKSRIWDKYPEQAMQNTAKNKAVAAILDLLGK